METKDVLVLRKTNLVMEIFEDEFVEVPEEKLIRIPHQLLKGTWVGDSEDEIEPVLVLLQNYAGYKEGHTFRLNDVVSFDAEKFYELQRIKREFMRMQIQASNELFGCNMSYEMDMGCLTLRGIYNRIVCS